jgi:hypothetical protein
MMAMAGKIEKALAQIDKQKIAHPWFHIPHIEIGFAIDGTRCNGTERLSSLLDTMLPDMTYDSHDRSVSCLFNVRKDMLDTIKACERTVAIVDKIWDQFFSKYEICPSCKGAHGWFTEKGSEGWDDCTKCEGLGFLSKGNA